MTKAGLSLLLAVFICFEPCEPFVHFTSFHRAIGASRAKTAFGCNECASKTLGENITHCC